MALSSRIFAGRTLNRFGIVLKAHPKNFYLRHHAFCSTKIDISPSVYPSPRKDLSVVDDYHGVKVADPYRWMENPDSSETKKFVDQLNSLSEAFIAKAPSRERLRDKLTELWNYPRYSCPAKHGDYYYYSYNSGLQNHAVIYQQTNLKEDGKVFYDVNKEYPNGLTSVSNTAWSKDGSIMALGLSENGSDWTTVSFITSDGKKLNDVITGIKHSLLSWAADNSGIFYSKYPDHKSAAAGTSVEKHEYHSLYFHKMGTDCSEDVLVYERRDNPDFMIHAQITDDGKYLLIFVVRGADPYNLVYYYDMEAVNHKITGKIEPKALFDKQDARYNYIDHDDTSMLIQTNLNSPMERLIRVQLDDPSKVVEVVGEDARSKMYWAAPIAGDRMIIAYLEDVKTALYVHNLKTGKRLHKIDIPIGSVSGFYGKKASKEMIFQFGSFLVPEVIYKTDFEDADTEQKPEIEELRRVNLSGLEENLFDITQEFYESKDGTKVPMFIISKKGLVRNGTNPAILYGYGGFNIAYTPNFWIEPLMNVKHFNAVIAVANIRGGSEYGEKWHEQGMRENKQNSFDDFIGAAEHLIERKYTSNEKLAIHGGSNGGLLVGAVSQQRPDLFGAVLNQVGVLDMLRFHKHTIGGAWVQEYGNPDAPQDFKYLYKYSPLHNIAFPSGGQWPSTLLMTADHDDRVVPSHTLKYAATLYEKAKQHKEQKNPLLVRVEVQAGHGGGKPMSKVIDESVDMYCFLERALGMKWTD